MTKKAIKEFEIHKYFTMFFFFFLQILYFTLPFFLHFFYPRHLPTPTPTTHTHDPRPPPTAHDPRHLATHEPGHLATLHISWLYTKLRVARSRRPSQLVHLGFLVWWPLKILAAGEQIDHFL